MILLFFTLILIVLGCISHYKIVLYINICKQICCFFLFIMLHYD